MINAVSHLIQNARNTVTVRPKQLYSSNYHIPHNVAVYSSAFINAHILNCPPPCKRYLFDLTAVRIDRDQEVRRMQMFELHKLYLCPLLFLYRTNYAACNIQIYTKQKRAVNPQKSLNSEL